MGCKGRSKLASIYHRNSILRQYSYYRFLFLRPKLYASYNKILSYIDGLSYKQLQKNGCVCVNVDKRVACGHAGFHVVSKCLCYPAGSCTILN